MTEQQRWAADEYGEAELGDKRRTRRLKAMAAGALTQPHGRITTTFERSAEREAAFRWLETPECESSELIAASGRAAARRASEDALVFVPIDGTSLNIADHAGQKGTGIVGARNKGARGLQVMSAIAVTVSGTALGLAHQVYWTRRGRKRRGGKEGGRKDRRRFASKESRHWVDVAQTVAHTFAVHAPATVPWFVLDRGGDVRQVLQVAHDQGLTLTVRASANRRLWRDGDEPRRYLRESLLSQPVRGCQVMRVPASGQRQARYATLMLRFARVELDLHNELGNERRRVPVWAVLVRESGTTPRGEAPLEWLLLTTHPVETLADAELVVHGYATRWCIEEFHKTWKSGACNVEAMQLHSAERMMRWAAILAAVALRIQRLVKLARSEPELPATVELTRGEVRAIIVATKHRKMTARPGDMLTIGEAVKWLGSLGGHSPSPSAGPPGPQTLARGLERIAALAAYFDASEM
jgi:Transposase DNA-binding/Transposase DDE domain